MPKHRLDLETLRRYVRIEGTKLRAFPFTPFRASDPLRLTRRDLLGVAAYAGLGFSPGLKTIDSLLSDSGTPFSYEVSESRIAFSLRGRERWVIDTGFFGGRPTLSWRRAPHRIQIDLQGARFPGTRIPADFRCDLRQGPLTWRMTFSFTLGFFQSSVPFVGWLAAREPARSPVRLDASICALGADGEFMLSGHATAEFSPDWVFAFTGGRVAAIRGVGSALESDRCRMALLAPGTIGLVHGASSARTLISLHRGARPWCVMPALSEHRQGRLRCAENAFDAVHLEAFEDQAGSAEAVFLAEAGHGAERVRFRPGWHDAQLDASVELPLVGARYVRLFDTHGATAEQALLARFSPEPVVIRTPWCALQVGETPTTPLFEWREHCIDGRTLQCAPALHTVSLPLPGALSEPLRVPQGTRLDLGDMAGDRFVLQTASPLLEQTPAIRQQAPAAPPQPAPSVSPLVKPGATQIAPMVMLRPDFRRELQIPGPSAVAVVRPEDLLVLKFEWRGLDLRIMPGQPAQLVRTPAPPGSPKPVLIVNFPPQHIAEQNFREEPPEKVVFPIEARIAGWSRLIFEVPDNLHAIPYTLEALLDWSRFRLIVAPPAWPPPEPPSESLLGIHIFKDIRSPGIHLTPGLLRPQSGPPARSPFVPQWYRIGGPARRLDRARLILTRGDARPFLAQLQQTVPLQRQAPLRPGIVPVDPKVQLMPQLKDSVSAVLLRPRPPTSQELANYTAIEAPHRLFLSPSNLAGWGHALHAVVKNGRMELWHTRLGVKRPDGSTDEADTWYRTLRAIWSPDYRSDRVGGLNPQPPPPVDAFLTLPNRDDRHQLVHLMANGTLPNWETRVARANRFMLSALGAWMDLRYLDVGRPPEFPLVEWRHLSVMGRDQYVRVVEQGFLFPFGHKAVRVRVTERKLESVEGRTFGVLRQRMFIAVLEPVKQYPAPGQGSTPSQGRDFPYRTVRITTLVTPNLGQLPDGRPEGLVPGSPDLAFWPKVNHQDFQFHIIGTDWAGQTSEFGIPLIFVEERVGLDPAKLGIVARHYAEPGSPKTASASGQKIAFTPSPRDGHPVLETTSLTFGSILIPSGKNPAGPKLPLFFPTAAGAEVRIPAVKQLLGTDVTAIRYADVYRDQGYGPANAGELFAVLLAPQKIRFTADKSGALATPNFDITGLSRRWGAVGGNVATIAAGTFAPTDFFSVVQQRGDAPSNPDQAKLLGCLPLGPLVRSDGPPILKVEMRPPENPHRIWTIFHWETGLAPFPPKPLPTLFAPWTGEDPDTEESKLPQTCCRAKLTLHFHKSVRLPKPGEPPAEPQFGVKGSLTNFQISLFKLIIISYRELRFAIRSGQKPDMAIRLTDADPVRFGGPLKFIDELRKFITGTVLGTVPVDQVIKRATDAAGSVIETAQSTAFNVAQLGASAKQTSMIPSTNVGVFSLQNIGFTIGLDVPYVDGPIAMTFGFGSRDNPFQLGAGPFGGAGCLVMMFCADRILKLEAFLEFGGKMGFDANGIASGGMFVTAGIYFELFVTGQQQGIRLIGSLRMGGQLSVMGLVTVSVEFKLELGYDSAANKVWGEAALVIKVEVLWFSDSVSVPARMEFGGSSSQAVLPNEYLRLVDSRGLYRTQGPGLPKALIKPPRIADLWSEADWVLYSTTFAPEW